MVKCQQYHFLFKQSHRGHTATAQGPVLQFGEVSPVLVEDRAGTPIELSFGGETRLLPSSRGPACSLCGAL